MARTVKRQPFSVSTSNNSYAKSQALIQAEFKGLSNVKNDVLADQMTFASAENIYVDDNMLLVSRPPFKFYDGEGYIEKQWQFGPYRLRLYKKKSGTNFTYTLRCISHTVTVPTGSTDKFVEQEWTLPTDNPEVTCAQIEDKIFIWFGGFDLVVFNTAKLYFESGIKYLYLPVLSLVVNGIETPLESENFLTSTGRRRYQYSALSSVDFESLLDREVRVGLSGAMTEGTSKYLYDVTVQKNQNKVLVYPHSSIGNNYHIDFKQGLETDVFLRYSEATHIIEVSFDGKYFQALPYLEDTLGLPQLTEDATHVVIFTKNGVAWCKLFTDKSDEYAVTFVFEWTVKPYAELDKGFKGVYTAFIPVGHFTSKTQFAYVYIDYDGTYPVLYAEWPNGDSIQEYGIQTLLSDEEPPKQLIVNDDIKVGECYIAPTEITNSSGLLVAILNAKGVDDKPDIIACVFHNDTSKLTRYGLDTSVNKLMISCRQCDISVSAVSLEKYRVFGAMNTDAGDYFYLQYLTETSGTLVGSMTDKLFSDKSSTQLRIDNTGALTDTYYYQRTEGGIGIGLQGQTITLPTLQSSRVDKVVTNNDNITLENYSGNIHLVEKNPATYLPGDWYLSSGQIVSGSLVAWRKNARTTAEYLLPKSIDESAKTATEGSLFYIERVSPTANEWQVHTGDDIYVGDIVRLRAYDNTYTLDAFVPGIPIDHSLTVSPWVYPASGDPTWSTLPKPWILTGDGGFREWNEQDPLPTGPVTFYGYVGINQEILPLSANETDIWLNVSGTIWTSETSTENILELDEYINMTSSREVNARLTVPTHHNVLREHYFSFESDGKHLLEVTQVKRDEDKMFSEDATDLLLYLPKRNEQVFANKITNLHPIADNILAVFTEQSIWNITASTLDDGTVVYSAPIVSKIPAGCRDGDDVMTALDGQALLLATSRGIAALAPQDFVATADNVMTYLSDPIQDIYYRFYADKVTNFLKDNGYDSQIKMQSYRYWLLFYRYMDRDILVFDTRNNTWWKWSTPYPIRQIVVDTHLHPIMQIDYSANNSLGGVSYVWKDHEDTVFTGTPSDDVRLPTGIKSRAGYRDDVIGQTLNGSYVIVQDNEFVDPRKVKEYASPIIKWHFMSQKLHFNQINNFKAIKGITVILKGDDTMHALLSTKTYRNSYHPEQSDVMQIPINELRTFSHRLNILHAINFQYMFENYAEADEETPLKLNSLTIKYEVKEGIR